MAYRLYWFGGLFCNRSGAGLAIKSVGHAAPPAPALCQPGPDGHARHRLHLRWPDRHGPLCTTVKSGAPACSSGGAGPANTTAIPPAFQHLRRLPATATGQVSIGSGETRKTTGPKSHWRRTGPVLFTLGPDGPGISGISGISGILRRIWWLRGPWIWSVAIRPAARFVACAPVWILGSTG